MTIKPNLPKIGDKVNILGIDARVIELTPESDWSWRLGLVSRNAVGAAERWWICLPTDYRTEDGFFIGDGNTAFVQSDDEPESITFRDDCQFCGEDATLDDFAEFIGPDGERVLAHSSCAAEHNLVQA